MKRLPLVLLSFSLLLSAQQPSVPAGLLQFPLPRDFTPTPQDLAVSGALLNAIRARFECKKCNGQEPGGRVGAAMLKLGSLGPAALATSYASDHCNDNGNCAIWLFSAQGEPQPLDSGVSYAIVTHPPSPCRTSLSAAARAAAWSSSTSSAISTAATSPPAASPSMTRTTWATSPSAPASNPHYAVTRSHGCAMRTEAIPAAVAARMPISASSKTRQSFAATPSRSAASWNGSGAGLPRA